ncbi:MAG TPA: MarC family protein [Polyangiaceae bacterium]|nr:MarC family protein [Polyangiaceae bacterium]
MSAFATIFSYTLSTLTALFVVVDPFGCVPLFVSVTDGDSREQKRRAAMRASTVAGAILALFAVTGTLIFRLLGVSEGAFRIAGGILLFLLAVDMLSAQRSRQRTTPEEEAEGANKADASVFPLAIPMLAGPGATSAVMVLVSRARNTLEYAIVMLAIVFTLVTTYWVLRGASAVADRLGHTGMNVLQRVMGLIVAAVAVQFVVDGIGAVWHRTLP